MTLHSQNNKPLLIYLPYDDILVRYCSLKFFVIDQYIDFFFVDQY